MMVSSPFGLVDLSSSLMVTADCRHSHRAAGQESICLHDCMFFPPTKLLSVCVSLQKDPFKRMHKTQLSLVSIAGYMFEDFA
mmetsp:Transcript_23505/g.39632  ORF Transcript_23505/g.39632 Transcript_23505/m.39632 type:complete len:82 (+) Transcript_23505:234-479(+)